MNKFFRRAGILACVFVVGVFLFSHLLNQKETTNTKEMGTPVLPVMYMKVADTTVNRMVGYRQELEEATERESLTLLPTDRSLTMEIQAYDCRIQGISYQVTSLVDGSLVENGKIKNLTEEGSLETADFQLETPILMNQEYMLRFAVDIGEETPVYYYTRLVQRGGLNVSTYLDFVRDFYETCLNKDNARQLASYLESDSSSSNSSFHTVTIKSSWDQVTWGSLSPTLVKRAVPVIKEANDVTVSIGMEYLISAQDSEGNTEYYTVQEFYRMRTSQGQIILLDFERTAEQIFDGNLSVLTDSGINLGVVGKDVQYVANQSADMVAFVTAGDLWLYNRSANKVTRIFSFRGEGEADERTENLDYDIQICRVDETGDVSFVVYGYMSAGDQEGRLGVSVYSYNAEQNVAEERLFLPVNVGWEVMKQNLSELSYVNSSNQLYLYLGDSLYQVNLEDASSTRLQEGMDPTCFVTSKSQQSLAWMEEMEEYGSSHVTVMDLETGETMEVSASEGERIRALGFINEDFIYGLAKEEDIVSDSAGNVTCAMYKICIQSISGQVEKEYQRDGIYVTKVTNKEGLLELERVSRNETGGFQTIENDHIMNNVQSAEDTVSVRLTVSERKGTQVVLEFTVSGTTRNLLSLKAQYRDLEEIPQVEVEFSGVGETTYYIYGKGHLQGLTTKVNEAIQEADDQVGVVLNGQQQYIWERGNVESSITLDVSTLPEGILQAPVDETAMQQILGQTYQILNLSGCSLKSLQYQISNGYPVAAKTSDTTSTLIVGYDVYNVWLYDAATGDVSAMATEDAQAFFASAGNIFVSYREAS